MFYSHFILAKKGPLGTVWIAAHLERKLRKNQITETNISASVDSIMFPEVPIALRLSGHLLLGVVRIYSKKVYYLYQDCTEALVKLKQAFNSVRVDLPPGATTAPFHSITLPETLEFDHMEEEFRNGMPDTHVTTRDQITLNEWPGGFAGRPQFGFNEQVPGGGDPYTVLYLDEEAQRHKTPVRPEFPSHVLPSREEDVLPPLPMDGTMGFDQMDMETDGLEEAAQRLREEPSENFPERETLRSAVEVPREEPFLMGLEELEKGTDIGNVAQTNKMDESGGPILEETPVMGEGTPAFDQGQTPSNRTSGEIPSDEDLLRAVLGGMSPALTVMPTPTNSPAHEERKRRPRKRKQLFDESIVLSNEFMKRQLENTDDIRRIRRKVPCSALEMWKEYRSSHVRQIFSEPSLHGMSTDLQNILKKAFIVHGVKVAFAEAPTTGFKDGAEEPLQSPQAPDIEMARFAPPEVETIPEGAFETAGKMEEPTFPGNEGVGVDTHLPEMLVPEVMTELEVPSRAELKASGFATPSPYGLSEVPVEEAPSVGISVYDGESDRGLKFLEEDSRHAAFVVGGKEEFTEEPGVGDAANGQRIDDTSGWSVRTRAVAQYLQTAFGKSNNPQGKLNLNEMLARRTRKESARMFFETLVLKSKDYLEVDQKEPYADIHLLPTVKLIKAKF